MYCTVQDMVAILPDPITVGDTNIGSPSPGRPEPISRSKLTTDEANRYIRFAEEEVDSRLRPYYVCPLRRVKTFETDILENVINGSSVEIKVHDSGVFSEGQLIRLQSKKKNEMTEILSVKSMNTLIVENVKNTYLMGDSKVSIVEFPDPIPLITARLAASYCFDQLFNAEQAPNISDYGKEQRKLAINSLDSILTGTVLLFGQDHTGRRFVRGSLYDAYNSPTSDFQFGREKQ